ncbi:MAG: hypothetical protein ACJ71R_13920 [Nitrososphaeraceae archaeon]
MEIDGELKNIVLERLRVNGGPKLDSIAISVVMIGHVKTFRERLLVGQEVRRARGVARR